MISDERYRAVAVRVLDDLVARLDEHGLTRQAELARRLRHPTRPPPTPDRPAVLARLDDAFPSPVSGSPPRGVQDCIRQLAPELPWTQPAGYLDDPPDPGFLDGYAHATILGSTDGQARPYAGDEAALGAVLLGPGVVYPPHQHPADEVYLSLDTVAWVHARDGRYVEEPAGRLVHHRPWQPHGMTVNADAPVLLIYLWTGDVRTPAAWCR